MDITFDPAKNEFNKAKHGLSLNEAIDFDWNLAVIGHDTRKAYGEDRYIAFGPLKGRAHVLVFVVRDQKLRVISLRKANEREVKRYAKP